MIYGCQGGKTDGLHNPRVSPFFFCCGIFISPGERKVSSSPLENILVISFIDKETRRMIPYTAEIVHKSFRSADTRPNNYPKRKQIIEQREAANRCRRASAQHFICGKSVWPSPTLPLTQPLKSRNPRAWPATATMSTPPLKDMTASMSR